MNDPKVVKSEDTKKPKIPDLYMGSQKDDNERDMSIPDSQEIYDNNISQYETEPLELEASQDEELQEEMQNKGDGR